MIKAINIIGQLAGFMSSILLAWGYGPVKDTLDWARGDGTEYKRDKARKDVMVRLGFITLAISFLIGALVTLVQ